MVIYTENRLAHIFFVPQLSEKMPHFLVSNDGSV